MKNKLFESKINPQKKKTINESNNILFNKVKLDVIK